MTIDPVAATPGTDMTHISPRDKAEILSQALPYIRRFHGKTIVINGSTARARQPWPRISVESASTKPGQISMVRLALLMRAI